MVSFAKPLPFVPQWLNPGSQIKRSRPNTSFQFEQEFPSLKSAKSGLTTLKRHKEILALNWRFSTKKPHSNTRVSCSRLKHWKLHPFYAILGTSGTQNHPDLSSLFSEELLRTGLSLLSAIPEQLAKFYLPPAWFQSLVAKGTDRGMSLHVKGERRKLPLGYCS